MRVYFDLDGTIADFYGVDGWLDAIRAEDTAPYDLAKPLGDLKRLGALCAAYGATVGVISWCARGASESYDKAVRRAKKKWLADNFPYAVETHIVKYGTPKHTVTKIKKDVVLVDDEWANCCTWENEAKRRKAIHARNFKQVEKELRQILTNAA